MDSALPSETTSKEELRQLSTLIERTNIEDPDPADVSELKAFLANHPEVWSYVGDISVQARALMIKHLDATPAFSELLSVGLRDLETQLGAAAASPLERLLIDQVVVCWLHFWTIQYRYSNVMHEEHSFQCGTHWEKRLSMAQSRFLKAIQTLARVRKIAGRSPLQINIAEQQINVASSAE